MGASDRDSFARGWPGGGFQTSGVGQSWTAVASAPRRPAAPAPASGQQRLRHFNLVQLLRLLRDTPGLSRADLAERSGLTRSTVGLLVQHLIDQGWLAEDATEATGALGRRPTPLRLDGRRFALVGAELAPELLRVVVVSVQGDLLHEQQAPLRSRQAAGAIEQLQALVIEVVKRARGPLQREVLGVGVGLPGAVVPGQGVLRVAPNFGWRDVPVAAWLKSALEAAGLDELPVLAENDADLAALGEMEFGPRPLGSPLVYVSCGIGLGSGIVVDDRLFTGSSGTAGEIGHTTLRPGGRSCSCGRQGCAEAYVGLRAVAEQALGRVHGAEVDHGALRDRLARRDAATVAAFEQAGRDLGVLLHNVWTVVDPQLIVLGGETVALGGADLVEPARQVLADSAARSGWAPPPVRVTRSGERAVALGGGALVLRRLLQAHHSVAPAAEKLISPLAWGRR